MPLFILVGILLLKGDPLGYLLSASTLILATTIGLSVVAGELMLGLSTSRLNTVGVGVFTFFLIAALALLVRVLASVRQTISLRQGGKREGCLVFRDHQHFNWEPRSQFTPLRVMRNLFATAAASLRGCHSPAQRQSTPARVHTGRTATRAPLPVRGTRHTTIDASGI